NEDGYEKRGEGQHQRCRKCVADKQRNRRSAKEAASEIESEQPLEELPILHEERLVEAKPLTDTLKIGFGYAARALRQHQGRIAGQANCIGDEQRHYNEHEQRLQNSFYEKSGHQSLQNAAASRQAACRSIAFYSTVTSDRR